MEKETKKLLKKKSSRAFRKDIYLLGQDEAGTNYWLEAPSWDCGWYWGFGYVETYTNNRCPGKSHDIQSHQHIDSSFMGRVSENGDYIHNIYDAPLLAGGTTFTEEEGWELSELFKQFYTLRNASDFFHACNANVTSRVGVEHDKEKCLEIYDYINKTMIPAITKRIIEILSE